MLTPSPFARPYLWPRGRRRGYGLGQDGSTVDTTSISYDTSSLPTGSVSLDTTGLPSTPVTYSGTTSPSTGTGVPTWLANIFTGAATTTEKIALQQTNPLYNLKPGTYYQSGPYGTVVSTAGVPVGGAVGLTTGGLGSFLPILLIGGVVLMFMARR